MSVNPEIYFINFNHVTEITSTAAIWYWIHEYEVCLSRAYQQVLRQWVITADLPLVVPSIFLQCPLYTPCPIINARLAKLIAGVYIEYSDVRVDACSSKEFSARTKTYCRDVMMNTIDNLLRRSDNGRRS